MHKQLCVYHSVLSCEQGPISSACLHSGKVMLACQQGVHCTAYPSWLSSILSSCLQSNINPEGHNAAICTVPSRVLTASAASLPACRAAA